MFAKKLLSVLRRWQLPRASALSPPAEDLQVAVLDWAGGGRAFLPHPSPVSGSCEHKTLLALEFAPRSASHLQPLQRQLASARAPWRAGTRLPVQMGGWLRLHSGHMAA